MVDGLIKVKSEYDFNTTLSRAVSAIKNRGITIFSIIDHRKNAEQAGMSMESSTLVTSSHC
jgi:uncharacterized protein (DUF302 family)